MFFGEIAHVELHELAGCTAVLSESTTRRGKRKFCFSDTCVRHPWESDRALYQSINQ
jgi:hypothetical protein